MYAALLSSVFSLALPCIKTRHMLITLGSLKARFAFSYFSCSQEENSEKGTVWRGKQARILFNTATRPSSVFKPLCRIIAFLLFSRKSLRKGRIPRQKLFPKEPIFLVRENPPSLNDPNVASKSGVIVEKGGEHVENNGRSVCACLPMTSP